MNETVEGPNNQEGLDNASEPAKDFSGQADDELELQEEIARLTAELAEQKDRHLRQLAETENMRRRLERERVDLIKFGLETFMKDLLPVLDSLEKALPEIEVGESNTEDSESSYLSGMLMVKRQLVDVVQKHGLESVSAAGKAFDPNLHQAIQKIESADITSDLVKDEYARGYMLHGRLLRPAMVSVLTPAT